MVHVGMVYIVIALSRCVPYAGRSTRLRASAIRSWTSRTALSPRSRCDLCVDTCADMCVDVCVDMCVDVCVDMCADVCV